MQMAFTRRTVRPILGIVGVAAAMMACSGNETPLAGNPAGADLAVGLLVSSTHAAPGQELAVAVQAAGREELGGLQGTLSYDPSALEFVGQATEGGKVTILNTSDATHGKIQLISYQGGVGIQGRSGTLVFAVKGGDYARTLKFDLQMATDLSGGKEIAKYTPAGTAESAELALPESARPMTMGDWNEALYADLWHAEQRMPHVAGQYLANLHYGNANLSAESGASCTSVNVLDASYIGNIAVGNNSVMAVDFPTRDPVVAGNVSPASSPIPGIGAGGSRTIDVLDAQAVANEAVGNDRPIVCDLIPGREPATGNVVTLSGTIAGTRTLTADTLYKIDGIVRVNGGGRLVILPGTRLEGLNASTSGLPSALYIERDGTIDAQGTQLQPIVFTCDLPTKFKGCWGGVVIAGSASINGGQGAGANTSATSPVIAGRAATGGCLEQDYEGSAGASLIRFGGCNDADSSGVIRYARFEYGGYVFASNKEINNFTLGGVGSRTVIEHVQAHGGSDDGIEVFGGMVNFKWLVITGNSDDGFDYSQGWSGKTQFVIVQQDSLDSDKGMEIDSGELAGTFDNLPRVNAQIYNITMVGELDPTSTSGVAGNNVGGMFHIRRGARPDHYNIVGMGYTWLLDLDDDATCPTGADLKTELQVNSLTAFDYTTLGSSDIENVCQPYTNGGPADIEGTFLQDGQNNILPAATNPLIAPFNVITPDWRPVSAAAVSAGVTPPNDGFFDPTATYRGAVGPLTSGGIPWYAGWTRGFQSNVAP